MIKRTLFCLLIFLLSVIATVFYINTAYAQENDFVPKYGCNALYTTDDPDSLADYMVELIGHQPVKTTLTSFVDELPCDNIDVGRIIFNVCGITGDEHIVCTAWNKEYPEFYSDDFYYEYYVNVLTAAKSQTSVVKEQVKPTETIEQPVQSNGFSINIIHVIVALLILAGLGYFAYNRSMYNSTPKTVEEN